MKGLIIKEWYCQKTAMWMFGFWAACSLITAFSGDTGLIFVATMVWFYFMFPSATFSGEKNKIHGETYEILAVSRGQILSAKYVVQSLALIFVSVLFGVIVAINRFASADVMSADELKLFITLVLLGMIYQSVISALLVGKHFIAIILASFPSALVPIIFLAIESVDININGRNISLIIKDWVIGVLFVVTVAVYLLCWKWAVKKVS